MTGAPRTWFAPCAPLPQSFWLAAFALTLSLAGIAFWAGWKHLTKELALAQAKAGRIELLAEGKPSSGLLMTIYEDAALTRPTSVRVTLEPFTYRTGYELKSFLPKDIGGLRFSGYLVTPAAGEYRFAVDANDGARIRINHVLVFDDWKSAAVHKAIPALKLPKGPVPFQVEWYNAEQNGWLGLQWYGPGAEGFIPASAFLPDAPAVQRP